MVTSELILTKLEYNLENLAFLRTKVKSFDQNFNPQLSLFLDIDSYVDKLLLNAYVEILTIGNEFVGFYAIYVNDEMKENAYLTFIAISDEYKGCGHGQFLLDRCINISKNKGFRNIKLEVYPDNEKAIRLYKKNGFVFLSDNINEYVSTHYMIKEIII